ncbi:MAG: hypothetical protein Q9216_004629 [Gyalolechia sp. 2 TL-2023]
MPMARYIFVIQLLQKRHTDDASNDRAATNQRLRNLGLTTGNIQATEKEDEGNSHFLPPLQLQVPQPRDRQDQECNISKDIRRRGEENADMRRIDTLAIRIRFIPKALERATDEELADDEGDEPCNANYTNSDAPHGELADGKNPMIKEEDREFQRKAADGEDQSTGEETLSLVS